MSMLDMRRRKIQKARKAARDKEEGRVVKRVKVKDPDVGKKAKKK